MMDYTLGNRLLHTCIALPLVLLGGCAVLKVDVDAYKGPLGNHEDVQTEQLSVMAVGAKPLLVHLRDFLEWRGDFETKRKWYDWWEADYVPNIQERCASSSKSPPDEQPHKKKWLCFEKPQAQNVNEVLGLYKDLGSGSELQALLDEAKAAIVDYKAARDKFLGAKGNEKNRLKREARDKVKPLWDIAIRGLELFDSQSYKRLIPEESRREVAHIVAYLTNPQRLACTLDLPEMGPLKNILLIEAAVYKAKTNIPFSWALTETKWTGDQYRHSDEILGRAIAAKPTKMAALLRRANNLMQTASITKTGCGDQQHGIVRGVSTDIDIPDLERLGFDRYEASLKRATRGLFAGGRLDRGLETMITQYLELADQEDAAKSELERARRQLQGQLIRFAEKMLFVANNDRLLGDDPTEDTQNINRYTLVLQAIGNAIQVQANELMNRHTHKVDLTERAHTETHAVRNALASSPDMAAEWEKIRKGPGEKELRENLDQRKVLDDLIALLRYELLAAKRAGKSSDEIARLEASLKAAYEHRSGMAYIRPAVSYLRSSLAATGLQGNPNLAWQNLLSRHSWRSWPFIGESLANPEQEKLDIRKDIDKQHWQNINSVQVSGAGNTNYAIAKDDVGNWYVKSYAADPEPMIRSAQRLAVFGAGGAVNTNLLRRLDLERQAGNTDLTENERTQARTKLEKLEKEGAGEGVPALRRVFNRYESRYFQETASHVGQLQDALGDQHLVKSIRDAWEAGVPVSTDPDETIVRNELFAVLPPNPTTFVDLNNARMPFSDDPTLKDNKCANSQAKDDAALKTCRDHVAKQRRTIVRALKDTRRFHDDLIDELEEKQEALRKEIQQNPGNKYSDTNKAENAVSQYGAVITASATSTLGRFILDHARERRASVKSLETSVTVLGEASQ